jgi:Spy/CpxP family protein refolding chaperone
MLFRKSTLLFAVLIVTAGTSAWAQPDGRQRGRGFFGGGGGGGDLGLLMREDVRKELEIVDEQMEKMRELQSSLRDEMREMFSGLRDLNEEERRAKFEELREKMETKRKEIETKVGEVLLPHQKDRLKQIGLRMQMRYRGTSGLLNDRLADELGITEEQKKRLQAAAEKAREELEEKTQKLRDEAREKILSELTPEQRKKLEDLLGDEFEPSRDNNFRREGGRGGARPQRPNAETTT